MATPTVYAGPSGPETPELWRRRARYFEARIAPGEAGCWAWTGPVTRGRGKNPYGRGELSIGSGEGERWMAHRLSWAVHRGPIPDGLTIDHLCRNTLCVNPDHLEPVTDAENTLRSLRHFRSENPTCPQGHEDWVWRSNGRGRYCATCSRERCREYMRQASKAHKHDPLLLNSK